MSVTFRLLPAQPQAPLPIPAFHCWSALSSNEAWCEFRRVSEGIHLRFPALADFIISENGTLVQTMPVLGLDDATLDHLQVNQVLPLALSAQGVPVFHASSVEMGEGAVAFLGASGRGKSTLATHLSLRGAPLITDDGLVLDWDRNRYLVLPSQPSVRLWQDSQDALVGESLLMGQAISFTSKARLLFSERLPTCSGPRPLHRAYFLGEGLVDEITISPMSTAQAAMEWVKHCFLLDINNKRHLASHFREISRLAAQGVSYRLDYPRRYELMDEVRGALLANFHN